LCRATQYWRVSAGKWEPLSHIEHPQTNRMTALKEVLRDRKSVGMNKVVIF
jgi:hypothetical protein